MSEGDDESEAQQCHRMAEMLRDVPGGIGEVIDYLEKRAALLEKPQCPAQRHIHNNPSALRCTLITGHYGEHCYMNDPTPAVTFDPAASANSGFYPCTPMSEWKTEDLLALVSKPEYLSADADYANGKIRYHEWDAFRAHLREKRAELDRRAVPYPKSAEGKP